jgi:XTP/dITP diphosphohydrolase
MFGSEKRDRDYTVLYWFRLTEVTRPRPGETLLIATTNPGKTREIIEILRGLPLRLVTLSDLQPVAEPAETGRTFAENAAIKALAYAAAAGLPTVAEDSGLAIDAIGGRPGVESARYPGRDYPERFRNLYKELAPHPPPWTARFVCSLAFVNAPAPAASPASIAFRTEATVEGEIAPEPRGTYGFGYDPIFFFPPYGCTLGEVESERKLAVAHRGKAFRNFREWTLEKLEV